MATFAKISALDFNLIPTGDSFVQAPIPPPNFEFQYSSDFDFYKPCALDFYFLDAPVNRYAVLRSDLASCYWESLKMKGRYILAAATGGRDEVATDPLSSTIPEEKLREINMIHPPFPPLHQLTYNFLLLPASPAKIREWISLWQSNSRQLSAWIAQAKLQSAKSSSCSWSWPPTPPSPGSIILGSSLPTCVGVTADRDDPSSDNNSSSSSDPGDLFDENPEPPSKCSDCFSTSSVHSNCHTPLGRVAHAFQAKIGKDILKRVRDTSPLDPQRDGDDPSKKQLVLWRPSLAKIMEMQAALKSGEVSSHSTHSSSNPILSTRVLDPRLGISLLTMDATGSVTLTEPVDGSATNSVGKELSGKV